MRGEGREFPEIVVDDLSGLQRRLAAELEGRARRAIEARGRFIIALPGGSVARAFFPTLAGVEVDWACTDFFWIDERALPPQDAESNYGLASSLWLTPARVPASRIHRLRGEDADLDRAARIAADELLVVAGNPPRLDLALVGVGEDGHVASIFPERADLGGQRDPEPEDRRTVHSYVVPVYDAPKPPPRRLTLTMPVLSDAGRVVVVALGRTKAAAVRDSLELADGSTPLADLVRRAQSTLMLLDHEAASLSR